MPAILRSLCKKLRRRLCFDEGLHVCHAHAVALLKQRCVQLGCTRKVQLIVKLKNLVSTRGCHRIYLVEGIVLSKWAGSLWDDAHEVGTFQRDADLFVHYPQRLCLDNGDKRGGRAQVFRHIKALLIMRPKSAAFGSRNVQFASQLARVFALQLQAIAIFDCFVLVSSGPKEETPNGELNGSWIYVNCRIMGLPLSLIGAHLAPF